jgi:hypothetical protein
MLFGELFQQVLSHNGTVLYTADVRCIRSLRDILFVFYKLELPGDPKQATIVVQKFKETDEHIRAHSDYLCRIGNDCHRVGTLETVKALKGPHWFGATIRHARRSLARVFSGFNPRDIFPRHGPGAVSTGERLFGKYQWRNIPDRIATYYPIDEYYYASLGHVCDATAELNALKSEESLAKVILVPKDSRGPRLISCEPLEFQWIQQGLAQAIMRTVESHALTKHAVRFTNQQPNQLGALMGSLHGRYATLDLNEASDRVSVGLVRLLFPEPVLTALEATRSLGTRLPDNTVVTFNKFAPMGSALCFPVLALCVWAVLFSGLRTLDANIQTEDVYVYGDDVIVPARLAEHAMIILESFGLKINRDKSCTKGFFRESCGMDAFKGENVTPVRFRTPWSSLRRPEVYTSYMAYANKLHERKYYRAYNLIVERLQAVYDRLPLKAYGLSVPSLPIVPETCRPCRRRFNKSLQKLEYLVYDVEPRSVRKTLNGWSMLLRFFSEGCSSHETYRRPNAVASTTLATRQAFSVREYTLRKGASLRLRWR